MDMVELNDKYIEAMAERGVEVLRRISVSKVSLSDASFIAAWVTDARAVLRNLSALPTHDDGVGMVTCELCQGSGWSGHPDSGSFCHKCSGKGVYVSVRLQAEQIERLKHLLGHGDLYCDAENYSLDQQVQKLTADKIAALGLLNHLIDWIVHDCGAEVPFTDEQDAVFAALETQDDQK